METRLDKGVDRWFDFRDQHRLAVLVDRLVLVGLAVVRREIFLGDAAGGADGGIEGFAAVIGEALAARQGLGVQHLVEFEGQLRGQSRVSVMVNLHFYRPESKDAVFHCLAPSIALMERQHGRPPPSRATDASARRVRPRPARPLPVHQCRFAMRCQLLARGLGTEQRHHRGLGPILLAVLAGLLGAQAVGDVVEQLKGHAQLAGETAQVRGQRAVGTDQQGRQLQCGGEQRAGLQLIGGDYRISCCACPVPCRSRNWPRTSPCAPTALAKSATASLRWRGLRLGAMAVMP